MIKEVGKYFSDKMNVEVESVENLSSLDIRNTVYKIRSKDGCFILKTFFKKNETTLLRSETEAQVSKSYGMNISLIPRFHFEDFSYAYFDFPVVCTSYIDGSGSKEKVKSEINASENNLTLLKASIFAIDSIHALGVSNNPGTLFVPHEGDFIDFAVNVKNLGFNINYNNLKRLLAEINGGDRMLRNYIRGQNLTEPKEFCLCHNDLSAHEVLVNDGSVKGIVDWERAVISDPIQDFAAYIFSFLNSAYNNKNLQSITLSKILPLFERRAIGSLAFYLAERAMIISLAYYEDYKPEKFKWAMKIADNLLSNSIQDMDCLISTITKTD